MWKPLDRVEAIIRPGITTEAINTLVHEITIARGAIPAPLNYRGFPKSVCTSVNEVICHGIPGPYVLKDGDIINVDVTPILKGYYADASKTFFVGTPGPGARKIVAVSRGSLKAGLDMVRPGNTLGDIGWVIQRYAEGPGAARWSGNMSATASGLNFMNRPRCCITARKEKGFGWCREWSLPSNR